MPKQCGHDIIAGDLTTKLRVRAIRLSNGDCPAVEWLESLTDRQQGAMLARLNMFAQRGWLRSPEAFNNLAPATPAEPRVDEIKHVEQNIRMYVADFAPGAPEAYATHGTIKPKKNQVASEVARARAIYKEGNPS